MDESCFGNVFDEFVKPSYGRWTSNDRIKLKAADKFWS